MESGSGFSLLELLLVMAVVGVLSSLVVVTIGKARLENNVHLDSMNSWVQCRG